LLVVDQFMNNGLTSRSVLTGKGEAAMAEGSVELPGSQRPPAAGADRVGDANPSDEVEVTITLRGPALPAADDVTGPPVDAATFAARYGADPDDAAQVKAELEKFGLDVYDVSLAGRSMHARGTVEQLDKAFGVTLGTYQSPSQGLFRGRTGAIHIPSLLEGIVTGVYGLDDRRVARRKTAPATAVSAPLTPADLESRYQFPPGDAAGQTVAIAEFGGAYFDSDVQAFCQKYNRAVPAVTPVSAGYPLLTIQQIEQMPQSEQQQILDASGEVMMDAEIVAALCPAADISVYFAPWNQKGWIDLLNAVAGLQPPPVALSISWGEAEDSPDWSGSAVQEINQRLQAAAMLGITVCAASGDDGAGDQMQDGRAHVNFPATSPFVLSVGGTMLTGAPPQEVVWWGAPGDRSVEGGGSSGGGVSTIFPRPSWQAVSVQSLNAGSIDGRVAPDIAALAGEPLYDLIFLGQDAPNGGTSAATPLWAALLARIAANLPAAHQARFLTPLLYAAGAGGQPAGQSVCTDITSGNNRSPGIPGGYAAGPGYDAVTGWGTPIGTALQQLLS
jgi:kumamolisin